MRRMIGLSVAAMTAATVAQPALAADAPSMLSVTEALTPLAGLTAPALTAHALTASILAAPAAAAPAMSAVAVVGPDYRLRAMTDVASILPRVTLDDQANRLRRGFGGTMVDYFPLGGDGFHISGGSRFYSRGPARAGTIDSRGLVDMRYVTLLSTPRAVLARASRRMTPALTLGYTRLIQGGMSLGVEGGAMLGRFDTLAGSLMRAPRLRGTGLSDGAGQLSQIARMTFGYHF